jgi:hypothetical protein
VSDYDFHPRDSAKNQGNWEITHIYLLPLEEQFCFTKSLREIDEERNHKKVFCKINQLLVTNSYGSYDSDIGKQGLPSRRW